MSVWMNDVKCEYMFLFPLKNLACKGFMIIFFLAGSQWPGWEGMSITPVPPQSLSRLRNRALAPECDAAAHAYEMSDFRRSRSESMGTYAAVEQELPPGGTPTSWADYRASIATPEKGIEPRYLTRTKTPIKLTIQGKVYNFLERPTGWKCFIYHFTV